jgi:TPR repeat protein
MRLILIAAIFWITEAAMAADAAQPDAASPADKPDQSSASKGGKTAEDPPKKTEYDKLPLPQLLARANKKDLTAQFELASRFNYGRGLPKNTSEALRWLRRAALAGQEDAARLLAVKLYNGHDVLPDFGEAMKWASMLADKGDIPAQIMLANMYANGEGSNRDLVQAYKWYAIAAVGEKREGIKEEPKPEQVQSAADNRDKLAGLLTDEQEAQAQQMASDWWIKKYVVAKKSAKPKKAASQ